MQALRYAALRRHLLLCADSLGAKGPVELPVPRPPPPWGSPTAVPARIRRAWGSEKRDVCSRQWALYLRGPRNLGANGPVEHALLAPILGGGPKCDACYIGVSMGL